MLKIAFNQFRCWESLQLEIPINQIILIKGNSGMGKTTIIQGIIWCLYGNTRLVSPNHLTKAKTSVILELPHVIDGKKEIIKIQRQKNPNRLILSYNIIIHEDKVAQAIIDDLFGTYDIWMASCYIGQRCRNTFLTIPNSNKLDFLNSLAFHEDDPLTYIQKIDNNITEVNTSYKEKYKIFTDNLSRLQLLISEVDMGKSITPEVEREIFNKIAFLKQEKERLLLTKSKMEVITTMLATVTYQINNIKNIVIEPPQESLLLQLQKYNLELDNNAVQKLSALLPLLQIKDQIKQEITTITEHLNLFPTFNNSTMYTIEDYRNVLNQERLLEENRKLATSHGLKYDENAICTAINQYQDMLESQEKLNLLTQQSEIIQKLKCLENQYYDLPDISPIIIPVPDYSKYINSELIDEVNTLTKKSWKIKVHIQQLEKGLDVLECPECLTSLRYTNQTLIKAENTKTTQQDIQQYQHILSEISDKILTLRNNITLLEEQRISEQNRYNDEVLKESKRIESLTLEKHKIDLLIARKSEQITIYNSQLLEINEKLSAVPNTTNITLLTPQQIIEVHRVIAQLKNINFITAPDVSSAYIQSWLNYHEMDERRSLVEQKYSEHVSKIPSIFINESFVNINNLIQVCIVYIDYYKKISQEKLYTEQTKTNLQQQAEELQKQVVEDVAQKLADTNTELLQLENMVNYNIKIQNVLRYQEQVSSEREVLVYLNKSFMNLNLLKERAIYVECKVLQDVVDNINNRLHAICSSLFDKDIDIKLNLFKTMKTTGNNKPVANFTISYQGGIFDNINQMSGGEGDRASLALTLALNNLSSCPLLILDESLASLDLNMKEIAIKTIRKDCNTTAIVVMHDGVEGLFDTCIEVDDNLGNRY